MSTETIKKKIKREKFYEYKIELPAAESFSSESATFQNSLSPVMSILNCFRSLNLIIKLPPSFKLYGLLTILSMLRCKIWAAKCIKMQKRLKSMVFTVISVGFSYSEDRIIWCPVMPKSYLAGILKGDWTITLFTLEILINSVKSMIIATDGNYSHDNSSLWKRLVPTFYIL